MLQDGDRLVWLSEQHPAVCRLAIDVAGRAVARECAFVVPVLQGGGCLLLGGIERSGAGGWVPGERVPARFLPKGQRADAWGQAILPA
jgi:hypothetical protein